LPRELCSTPNLTTRPYSPVRSKVASDLATSTPSSKKTIIDIFAGAGGNTIAFALSGRWDKIVAIEKDASVLACAQHNAKIYSVEDRITWVHDDCFSYVRSNSQMLQQEDPVIFASPPWGGPGYRTDEVFNLETMQPYSLGNIFDLCKGREVALFLPRTSDLRQIAKLAPEGKMIEVVQYCMEGASKALVAYIPPHKSDESS
jgi:trimethylguanosine synthase